MWDLLLPPGSGRISFQLSWSLFIVFSPAGRSAATADRALSVAAAHNSQAQWFDFFPYISSVMLLNLYASHVFLHITSVILLNTPNRLNSLSP